jgi:thiol-disulfide isomerase/thioredoxin
MFMEPTPTDPAPSRTGILILATVAIIGALIAIAAFSGRADPSPTAQVAAPELAPDFTVDLLDGSTFNLVDHLETDGRPVILNLWASWCAPCRAEMPDFDTFQSEQPGIVVIGVAVSDREDLARTLADELGVSYLLGFDATETVAAAYPPVGMPATWFIGEDRTIRKQVTGQISLATLRELAAGSFGF